MEFWKKPTKCPNTILQVKENVYTNLEFELVITSLYHIATYVTQLHSYGVYSLYTAASGLGDIVLPEGPAYNDFFILPQPESTTGRGGESH